MFKKFKTLFLSGIALILILSTFATPADAAARKGFDSKKVGGKLVFSTFADATRLTPGTTSDAVSNRLQGMMFDALVTTDIKNNIIPSLATSWKIENNTKKFTLNLRKDVKFHDGKPLTADDVVFTYQMLGHKDSINPYKGTIAMIDKVSAKDKYTVVFDLKDPSPLFLNAITFAIIPKHKFPNGVKSFNDSSFHRNPVGSGPFKFKEWKTAQRVVLVANKDYWNGRPYMDQITMKILPDANVEVVNLLKYQVDFVESVNPKSVATVQKNKNLKIVKYDQGRYDYIGLNQKDPLFADMKVRQALSFGLNRQAIVNTVLLKNAQLASGPIHPLEAPYNKNVKPLAYDVKKANDLLDDAGWKMGSSGYREKGGKVMEVTLTYNNGNKVREDIAKMAQQDWKKIGVKTTIRSYDFSIWLEKIDSGEVTAHVSAWSLGTNPDKYGLWHSSQIPSNNNQGVKDARVDKIMEDFRKEPNAAKRNALYQELHKILNDNAHSLWLHHPKGFAGMHKDLAGVKFSLYSRYFNIEDWYWNDPKKRK
ncbi:ABC transporter substrate-binding protein [Neobacillus sp. SCS-31]|uniref:ABC transporter substrate-binding protein n=1 Tax=Neobacillus oceani TaxID=3115292 RepID=UPI0039058AC7